MNLEKMMETYKRENSVTPREEKILETIQKSKEIVMEVSVDSKEMVDVTGDVACFGISNYAISEGHNLFYENAGSCFSVFYSDDYS